MTIVGTIITRDFLLEALLALYFNVALGMVSLVLSFTLLILAQGFSILAITDYIVEKLDVRHVFIEYFSVVVTVDSIDVASCYSCTALISRFTSSVHIYTPGECQVCEELLLLSLYEHRFNYQHIENS